MSDGSTLSARSREQERRSAGSREQGAGAQEHGEQGAARCARAIGASMLVAVRSAVEQALQRVGK